MFLIDSHIHLYLKDFKSEVNTLIEEAQDHNIKQFLLPNIDLSSIDDVISLCKQYPKTCYPMIGLHPCSVKKNYLSNLEKLEKKMKLTKFIAIGEIGIDLYWDKSLIEEQKNAFRIQIKWAKKHKLPIVVHCRNSFDEIYKILEEEVDENLHGVLHCFGGTLEQANKLLNLNFFLGIGGVLTFKNSNLDSIIKKIPLEKIIIETDAPYLAPDPYRGKRNEPKYLYLIAKKLCEIKNISMTQLTMQLYKNTNFLFFNEKYLISDNL
tara:strand:- start:1083 stop:1877 length:795 start_codon:yes stop_codon:yes gene_type:complete